MGGEWELASDRVNKFRWRLQAGACTTLGYGATPLLVPLRIGGCASLSMPRRQHAAGRYEVLVPSGTHRCGTGLLQCSPPHLYWDSDSISAHAQEPTILITPN